MQLHFYWKIEDVLRLRMMMVVVMMMINLLDG